MLGEPLRILFIRNKRNGFCEIIIKIQSDFFSCYATLRRINIFFLEMNPIIY